MVYDTFNTWSVGPIVNDTFEYVFNGCYLIENMTLFFFFANESFAIK